MFGRRRQQATLPKRFEDKNLLKHMKVGTTAFTLPWGMWVDDQRRCWLHPDYPADPTPSGNSQMRVKRTKDGFVVWPPHGEKYTPQAEPGYVSPADTKYLRVIQFQGRSLL